MLRTRLPDLASTFGIGHDASGGLNEYEIAGENAKRNKQIQALTVSGMTGFLGFPRRL